MTAVSSSTAAGMPLRGRRRPAAPGLAIEGDMPRGEAPLYDAVYAEMCRVLMQGGIAPDEKLSARALAARLGTSVTPVKEALRRLRADGVVYAPPKSAFRIMPMTAERYRALLDIRVRLEPLAAEDACRRGPPDLAARLRILNDRYRATASDDTPAFLAANHAFHFALYEAAGRPDLLDIIRGLWLRTGPYLARAAGIDPALAAARHDRLVAAVSAGDARAASAAVRDDLEDAARVILQHLPPSPPEPA